MEPAGAGGCYSTIQAAIDAAIPGDTIDVAAGTYAETLNISKDNLSISGVDAALVTINVTGLAGSNSSGIYVTADGVTLEGLTVMSDGVATSPRYGIKYGQTTGGTLQHLEIQGIYRTGIDLLDNDGMLLDDISTHDNGGNGIGMRDTINSTLQNITTYGNDWGGCARPNLQ